MLEMIQEIKKNYKLKNSSINMPLNKKRIP